MGLKRMGELERKVSNGAMVSRSIYEPKDSRFRPWNISTLIAFFIGRFFGRLFRRRRKGHVAKENRS